MAETPYPSLDLDRILYAPGWTRYGFDGTQEPVEVPRERVIFYDTETVVKEGNHPILGTAMSLEAHYVWMSPRIFGGPLGDLIPLRPDAIAIAHFLMFDLSKTSTAYGLTPQKPHGICTMAMHSTMSGLGGEQVSRFIKSVPSNAPLPWLSKGCGDSLQALVKHYTGTHLEKEARNIFVTGSSEFISQAILGSVQGEDPLGYSIRDTEILGLLWIPLWKKFRAHCPSLVTLAGILESSQSILPMTPDFHQRVVNNSLLAQAKKESLDREVAAIAHGYIKDFLEGTLDYEGDPWLSQLDWTPAKSGKFKGYPAWYRKAKGEFGAALQSTPLLLKMTWKGEPVVHDPKLKWGFNGPNGFERIPHPEGEKKNVGSLVGKHFASLTESGVLGSQLASEGSQGSPKRSNIPLELSRLSYWKGFKSRFQEVYTKPQGSPGNPLGLLCVPQTSLMATWTGRKVEKLWLTAAQCKPQKIGTDLFHAVQAPEGWSFVGADMDTQEVRIAGFWGDFYAGMGLGGTPMSQSAIMGHKDLGTDPHTVTAKIAGIPRQDAKVANFRDIFGGGAKTQTTALQTSHPDWDPQKVSSLVESIILAKRGTREQGVWKGGTDSEYHNQANAIAGTPNFRLPLSQRQIPHIPNVANDPKGTFFTTRYNFPVQGTGVDLLHVVLGLMPILTDLQGIPQDSWCYIFDRHDEIWYASKDPWTRELAEALNQAHMLAWACFLDSLGFTWFPSRLSRFSAVNVDKVFRKEVSMPTDAGYGNGWELPDGFEIH
jgi:DNA polymerase gamma 1